LSFASAATLSPFVLADAAAFSAASSLALTAAAALAFVATPLPRMPGAAVLARQPTILHMQVQEKEQTFAQKWAGLNTMNKQKMTNKDRKPMASPKRLPPAMFEVTQKFKKVYEKKQLELLWGALLKCYGDANLAEQAVRNNPQILNPSYSFCNTMIDSKEVLFDMMGKEEALEVMLKNPAVLQCGPSLDTLGPDEIKGFANLRSLGNKIPDSLRSVALIALLAFVVFPIFASNNEALDGSLALQIAKVGNGVLFALLVEGSRIVIVGTIVKGKLSGDERVAKAAEAEARRMGKGLPGGGKSTGEKGKKQWLGF